MITCLEAGDTQGAEASPSSARLCGVPAITPYEAEPFLLLLVLFREDKKHMGFKKGTEKITLMA